MAGQIIRRNAGTFTVRIFIGRDASGKRKYFNKTIHGKKKDAEKYLVAKLREKDLGIFVEPASIHLGDFLDRWLADTAKPRLRESTYDSYCSIIELYIKPKLQNRRLCDLETHEIQKVYREMLDSGLSARTIRYAHTVLSSALKHAVKLKMLVQNPCGLCDLPRQERREMRCFTPDETAKFLLGAQGTKWYCLFLLALETGMRPEEYLGLQWKDVDFENHELSVRRALVHRSTGGYLFTEPKTTRSRRRITLSDSLMRELKNYRRVQLEARIKLGSSYENLDLVFATELGTPLDSKNLRNRHFKPLLVKAGLTAIRLYDLRHTTATLLLSKGINPKIVSERLGHASIVLTLDTYSHVLPSMQRDASDQLEKLMFGT